MPPSTLSKSGARRVVSLAARPRLSKKWTSSSRAVPFWAGCRRRSTSRGRGGHSEEVRAGWTPPRMDAPGKAPLPSFASPAPFLGDRRGIATRMAARERVVSKKVSLTEARKTGRAMELGVETIKAPRAVRERPPPVADATPEEPVRGAPTLKTHAPPPPTTAPPLHHHHPPPIIASGTSLATQGSAHHAPARPPYTRGASLRTSTTEPAGGGGRSSRPRPRVGSASCSTFSAPSRRVPSASFSRRRRRPPKISCAAARSGPGRAADPPGSHRSRSRPT